MEENVLKCKSEDCTYLPIVNSIITSEPIHVYKISFGLWFRISQGIKIRVPDKS